MNLRKIFWSRSTVTDKYGQKENFGEGHSYGLAYELILEKYRGVPSNILEIGTNFGGGSACFCEYLPQNNFYSLDITDRVKWDISPSLKQNFNFFHGSYDDPKIIDQLQDITFDVIIDDGSHALKDQQKAIELYLPLLSSNGIFIIEDIQTPDTTLNQLYSFYIQKGYRENYAMYHFDFRYIRGRGDDVMVIIQPHL